MNICIIDNPTLRLGERDMLDLEGNNSCDDNIFAGRFHYWWTLLHLNTYVLFKTTWLRISPRR